MAGFRDGDEVSRATTNFTDAMAMASSYSARDKVTGGEEGRGREVAARPCSPGHGARDSPAARGGVARPWRPGSLHTDTHTHREREREMRGDS